VVLGYAERRKVTLISRETRGRVLAGPSFRLGTLSTHIASRAARSDVDLFIARTGQTDNHNSDSQPK